MFCKIIKANIEKFDMINSISAYTVMSLLSTTISSNWLITKHYSCCKQSNETDSLLVNLLLKYIPRLNGECQELDCSLSLSSADGNNIFQIARRFRYKNS